MSHNLPISRKERKQMKRWEHISKLDLPCADTYTLAKFIQYGNKYEKESAMFEWKRRIGKPFPYHPSYENDTYPLDYVKKVMKSKGIL